MSVDLSKYEIVGYINKEIANLANIEYQGNKYSD